MTDEELAEKWVDKNITLATSMYNPQAESIAKQSFLAGLKADKPEWHNLQEDLNDVPNDYHYVWTNVGAGYHSDDGWWDDFGRLQGVTAWREPKF